MVIKKLYLPLLTFLLILSSFTFQNSLSGTYWGPNKKSKIQLFKKNDLYFGELIWVKDSVLIDKNNKDEKLRDRNLVGQNLFFSLKYLPINKVWKGKFYDFSSGSYYDCDLWLTNNNKTLMARGYSEHSFLTQLKSLQRID